MYEVIFNKVAFKDIEKLDKQIQIQIFEGIDKLAANPFIIGSPLTGRLKGLWKFRMTEYRIVYEPQAEKLIIHIVRVGHRKDIYKKFER